MSAFEVLMVSFKSLLRFMETTMVRSEGGEAQGKLVTDKWGDKERRK